MFDQDYFENVIRNHVGVIGSGLATVEIHLHSGVRYLVSGHVEATATYVALQVYPPAGTEDMPRTRPGKPNGEPIDDLVVLPYGVINHIRFTTAAPVDRRMGFKP